MTSLYFPHPFSLPRQSLSGPEFNNDERRETGAVPLFPVQCIPRKAPPAPSVHSGNLECERSTCVTDSRKERRKDKTRHRETTIDSSDGLLCPRVAGMHVPTSESTHNQGSIHKPTTQRHKTHAQRAPYHRFERLFLWVPSHPRKTRTISAVV